MRSVPVGDWSGAVEAAYAEGYTFFDLLTGVDEIDRTEHFRVVLVVRSLADWGETLAVSTEVPRDDPRLVSVTPLYPGARWAEREVAELFGMTFEGGATGRLLLAPEFEGTPLRKDEPLAARTAQVWPGATDPGKSGLATGRRRRQR